MVTMDRWVRIIFARDFPSGGDLSPLGPLRLLTKLTDSWVFIYESNSAKSSTIWFLHQSFSAMSFAVRQ